jgi:hypothetical protein
VKDDYYYIDQGHYEKSDGKSVTGSYRVLLPDGRTQVHTTRIFQLLKKMDWFNSFIFNPQIVTYVADDYGYRADVKYEGTAKPYEYKKPSYKAPVSEYKETTYTKSYEAPKETYVAKEATYEAPKEEVYEAKAEKY